MWTNQLMLGSHRCNHLKKRWPAGFHDSLSRRVVTMLANINVVKVGFTSVCDSNLIFSRLLGLQHSRNINIDDVLQHFQHEVAPVSTYMFDDKGGMRIAVGKSALKNKIQVEISTRFVPEPDITTLMAAQFYGLFIGQEMEQFKILWTMYSVTYTRKRQTTMCTICNIVILGTCHDRKQWTLVQLHKNMLRSFHTFYQLTPFPVVIRWHKYLALVKRSYFK